MGRTMLNNAMRGWLTAPGRERMLTHQVVSDFIRVFRLNPEDAGQILAQWIKEKWAAL